MSNLLATGDLVQVIEGTHIGQVGVVQNVCTCPFAIFTLAFRGELIYVVSIDGKTCFPRRQLRKLDGDEDPNRVVEWDQVPGGKPKVEEAA